jgi:dienelactone hydrolase
MRPLTPVVTTTCSNSPVRPTVETTRIRKGGLVGVLCTPDGIAPAPGILLLGGSEGGLHERDAQVLAAEGFTVLALAYFGAPGLPSGLVDIPLEYFFRALGVLAEQPRANGERLGITGGSRGGEAALLVAAHDERVSAVASVVGSGVVTAGIDFQRGALLDILGPPTTNSWTLGGEPIPYLDYVIDDALRESVEHNRPIRLVDAFPPPPTDAAELERVSIAVENIRGPVLLLSAGDDASWPCVAYSEVAANRLRDHPHPVEHRIFDNVGHTIAGPPGTSFTTTRSPGPGVTFEMGGTPAANTAARADAWQATVAFFAEHLPD